MGRKVPVLLPVVSEAQRGVEGLEPNVSLDNARPLPPGMNPLCIQDMVWRQQEARPQEFEEALKPTSPSPQ